MQVTGDLTGYLRGLRSLLRGMEERRQRAAEVLMEAAREANRLAREYGQAKERYRKAEAEKHRLDLYCEELGGVLGYLMDEADSMDSSVDSRVAEETLWSEIYRANADKTDKSDTDREDGDDDLPEEYSGS